MKSYTIDLCSFSVEAENEQEATEKAIKMIKEDGYAEIDRILEEDGE